MASVRHRCRRNRGDGIEESGHRRKPHSADSGTELNVNDRRNRGAQDSSTRRTSVPNEVITTHTPSWTELAREAAHVSIPNELYFLLHFYIIGRLSHIHKFLPLIHH